MEEEGLFNKYLFSSMDDDTKNKKYPLSSMEDIKKETENIHLALSK